MTVSSVYVITIIRRNPNDPFGDKVLADFGVDTNDPSALIKALQGYLGLLESCKTPEKVVEFVKGRNLLNQAKISLK